MTESWTFTRKIAAGFIAKLFITLVLGVIATTSLRALVADKNELLSGYAEPMLQAQRLNMLVSDQMADNRGYYLTANAQYLTAGHQAQADYDQAWKAVWAAGQSGDERALLDAVEQARLDYKAVSRSVVQARQAGDAAGLGRLFDRTVAPRAQVLKDRMEAYFVYKAAQLEAAKRRSSVAADRAMALVAAIALLSMVLGAALAVVLTRTLSRQLGAAVSALQSSSTELQAAANQQASGSGEQATAMTEVSTTMKELLATSRQIAQSAQRVARIADETAAAARAGDRTLQQADEAVGTIRRQVDQIVTHMLDLGKKSQQIGAILAIITELTEQTNILSINATIEAAGAGEHGKRFAAVAEEVRKLADRVSGSTRDIRVLVEEIRAAANTTVMATEDGSKAVDAGTRQFDGLAAALHQIVALVETTVEAAREIELSTQQQSTAVEQVNVAIHDAAQSARETEASSHQTLQTSSQLAEVSRNLHRLMRSRVSA